MVCMGSSMDGTLSGLAWDSHTIAERWGRIHFQEVMAVTCYADVSNSAHFCEPPILRVREATLWLGPGGAAQVGDVQGVALVAELEAIDGGVLGRERMGSVG